MPVRAPALASALVLAALACGPGEPPPRPPTPVASTTTEPAPPPAPDEPPPALRTGAVAPIDGGTVQGTVVGRFDDAGIETITVSFVLPPALSDALNEGRWVEPESFAVVDPVGGPLPSSFVAAPRTPASGATIELWSRRPAGATGPVRATVIVALDDGRPGLRFSVEAPAPTVAHDPKRRAAFGAAFADYVRRRMHATPFGDTAAARVRSAYVTPTAKPKEARVHADLERFDVAPDLTSLMRSTTGSGALSAALAHDRALRVGPASKRTVKVDTLTPPTMESHPWAAMGARVGKAPDEPMALLVPADGWYVRSRSLGALFRLLDEADAWGTAAVRLAEEAAFDSAIAARYETQLGLRRSALARAFGDGVVGEVAVVGSDPYLREGSDVTVLFRVKSRPAFEIALADALSERAAPHGAPTVSTVSHQGDAIAIAATADGAVRRHRASIGDVEIVSNSVGATRRVLDAARGRAPSLGKEPDVLYALARDAGEAHDVIAIASEALVRRVVGPAHKIAEARRQMARAELLAPGAAAVLHGWLRGAAPASADALVKAKLLDAKELTHDADGQAISFEPGRAPRSPWGTPAFMTPLVDLPAVTTVSPAERDAYAQFKRFYEEGWAGEPFDPIALRVAVPEGGPLTAHLRVLPIPRDRDVDELLRIVGDGFVRAEATPDGARFVLSLSGDERWRAELALPFHRILGGERKTLDWIGEWAAFGVADRNGLLHAMRALDLAPELPTEKNRSRSGDEELAEISRIPLWAAVGVRSPATLGVLLTVLRKLAADAMPGVVSWGESGREGDAVIVGVTIAGSAIDSALRDRDVKVFYSLVTTGPGGPALYVSLKEDVLRALLRDHAAGRGPRAPGRDDRADDAPQALADVAAKDGGPIATSLVWMAEQSARDHARVSRQHAEWFLHAGGTTPPADLALAYLGAAPTTPSGKPFVVGPTGVTDPDRGDDVAPRFPAVPIAGTPIAAVASRLARVRVETRFDDEPGSTKAAPLRSFAARITVEPRR